MSSEKFKDNIVPMKNVGNNNGGNNGGGGMDIDSRVTKVETHIGNIDTSLSDIKTDIREIRSDLKKDFRWTITGFIALLGVMAHGFHWI